jgi:GDP-L-fucose synthase
MLLDVKHYFNNFVNSINLNLIKILIKDWKNIKVLVVGSNGLVGSTVSRILSRSHKVTDLIKSTRDTTDLFSLDATKKLIQSTSPDLIVMSAAKVGGILANNNFRTEFILENLKINMNIFESCIGNENIKIINLGSSCIYPLNSQNPIKEEYFMTGILEPTNSPYAMAKIAAIEMGDALEKQYGNSVLNLMPTNLYGPNDKFSENESHVIPGLILRMHKAKVENEKNFLIWGTGKPLREFLYVDDLAYAIDFLLDKNWNSKILNIGSGVEISIKDLAYLIKKIVGYKGKISFDNSKPDGNPRKLLDSTKIHSLGWRAITSLEDGLTSTYNWFKKNY